jgi:ProP effector
MVYSHVYVEPQRPGPHMTSEEKKRERTVRARQYLQELTARYPDCFTDDPQRIRPLAIGIQRQIRADEASVAGVPDAATEVAATSAQGETDSHAPESAFASDPTVDITIDSPDSATDVAVVENNGRVPGWLLRHALSIYTRSTPYLQAVVEGRRRCRLDGSDAEEITDKARAFATGELEERQRRRTARREAQVRKAKRKQTAQRSQDQSTNPPAAPIGETGSGDKAPPAVTAEARHPARNRSAPGRPPTTPKAGNSDQPPERRRRSRPTRNTGQPRPEQPGARTEGARNRVGSTTRGDPPAMRQTAEDAKLTPEQRRAAKLRALLEKFNQR